jgi:hypothetical protein
MDEVDRVFVACRQQATVLPIIACFYTGPDLPGCCAPMPRSPLARIGVVFGQQFPSMMADALSLNPAIHDGAVMIGRAPPSLTYIVTGWSYRLFPAENALRPEPNRGSAFNSCAAMSTVPTIDRVYLVSADGVYKFTSSGIELLQGDLGKT